MDPAARAEYEEGSARSAGPRSSRWRTRTTGWCRVLRSSSYIDRHHPAAPRKLIPDDPDLARPGAPPRSSLHGLLRQRPHAEGLLRRHAPGEERPSASSRRTRGSRRAHDARRPDGGTRPGRWATTSRWPTAPPRASSTARRCTRDGKEERRRLRGIASWSAVVPEGPQEALPILARWAADPRTTARSASGDADAVVSIATSSTLGAGRRASACSRRGRRPVARGSST